MLIYDNFPVRDDVIYRIEAKWEWLCLEIDPDRIWSRAAARTSGKLQRHAAARAVEIQ